MKQHTQQLTQVQTGTSIKLMFATLQRLAQGLTHSIAQHTQQGAPAQTRITFGKNRTMTQHEILAIHSTRNTIR